jgi:hypothetical protein
MWRGFVASAVAAVSLQWVNPFGTSKLVLFQVTNASDTWRAFELVNLTQACFLLNLMSFFPDSLAYIGRDRRTLLPCNPPHAFSFSVVLGNSRLSLNQA